jgi:hypothetical protein
MKRDNYVSPVFYNCMVAGVVHASKCDECFRNDPELKRLYHRRANCVKNNAEKEPTEF